MKTWKIGKVLDIDVSVHWTFFLLVGYVALHAPTGGAVVQVALLLSVFGCVFLHELGHAMAARQLGIQTSEIMLLPVGGVANLERMPRRPLHEFYIAVAGPLVNVVIASAIWLAIGQMGAFYSAAQISGSPAVAWARQLMWINVGLVLFNMLPAFPMDGGRVLRAGLAAMMPFAKATNTAAFIGRVVALVLAIIGVASGAFTLVLVAAFVAMAGAAEARMVTQQDQARWATTFYHTPSQTRSAGGASQHESTHGATATTSTATTSTATSNSAGKTTMFRAAPGVVVWDSLARKYRVLSN